MKDEQTLTDEFESACGCVSHAQRLFKIYKDSYKTHNQTKEQVFEAKAKAQGFTQKQIQALYRCQ